MTLLLTLLIVIGYGYDSCATCFSSLQDTIKVQYEGKADLTEDGLAENVVVSAIGSAWNELDVYLEILSDAGDLLYADKWSSNDWCHGEGYLHRKVTVEVWVRQRLMDIVDPDVFRPDGRRASHINYGGRQSLHSGVELALYEQLWRDKYNVPLHSHLLLQVNKNEIVNEFQGEVSEAQVSMLLDESGAGIGYSYRPHWDALLGILWIESLERFALVLFVG